MRLVYLLAALVTSTHRIIGILRHLGAFGLFLLAIVDSSPIPGFGGPDILTAILAARQPALWYYYAAAAVAGSVIGAWIAYRLAHRAGLDYLNRKFGKRKVHTMLKYFERWGTGALAVFTAVPGPFPTSTLFAAAGVLDYPFRRFLIVVAISRVVRYGAIAAIASLYGRRFIGELRHPGNLPGCWFGSSSSRSSRSLSACCWRNGNIRVTRR